ncbi:DUF6527 family protein [Nitrospira sp. Nam74]
MKRRSVLKHEFVEYIPSELKEGTLYVCTAFGTAAHKCCCGCGKEVITPIGPTDWQLAFDGEAVSLYPSIGNWSFECESHYWIKRNRVVWAARWSRKEIDAGRAYERAVKDQYFSGGESPVPSESFWERVRKWWFKQ